MPADDTLPSSNGTPPAPPIIETPVMNPSPSPVEPPSNGLFPPVMEPTPPMPTPFPGPVPPVPVVEPPPVPTPVPVPEPTPPPPPPPPPPAPEPVPDLDLATQVIELCKEYQPRLKALKAGLFKPIGLVNAQWQYYPALTTKDQEFLSAKILENFKTLEVELLKEFQNRVAVLIGR